MSEVDVVRSNIVDLRERFARENKVPPNVMKRLQFDSEPPPRNLRDGYCVSEVSAGNFSCRSEPPSPFADLVSDRKAERKIALRVTRPNLKDNTVFAAAVKKSLAPREKRDKLAPVIPQPYPVFPGERVISSTPGAKEVYDKVSHSRGELDKCHAKLDHFLEWLHRCSFKQNYNVKIVAACLRSQLSQTEAALQKLEGKKIDSIDVSGIPDGEAKDYLRSWRKFMVQEAEATLARGVEKLFIVIEELFGCALTFQRYLPPHQVTPPVRAGDLAAVSKLLQEALPDLNPDVASHRIPDLYKVNNQFVKVLKVEDHRILVRSASLGVEAFVPSDVVFLIREAEQNRVPNLKWRKERQLKIQEANRAGLAQNESVGSEEKQRAVRSMDLVFFFFFCYVLSTFVVLLFWVL